MAYHISTVEQVELQGGVQRIFYIFIMDKCQIYIPYDGYKHFSETGRIAELFFAVLSCEELLEAIDLGVDQRPGWRGKFNKNGITFLCVQSNDAGDCIKIYHSESKSVYAAHTQVRVKNRYEQACALDKAQEEKRKKRL